MCAKRKAMKTAIVAVALCLAAPAIAEDAVPLPRARPSEVIDDLARKEWGPNSANR